jgi:predicted nucleic acid-binding protein
LYEDALIAATAQMTGMTVATRNVSDLASFGVPLFDPFGFRPLQD